MDDARESHSLEYRRGDDDAVLLRNPRGLGIEARENGEDSQPVSSLSSRVAALTALVITLELFVFRDHWLGVSIPPWDFLGQYNVDAYYWWTHGGFFSPAEWVPTSWAGYPAAAVLQNSGWYLPVGLLSAFTPYTLHAAAVLAALHVAWGMIGAYCLVARLTGRFGPALFAGVAWFFAVGAFSNASHVDIARAYAWVPWVLLVMSPRWEWTTWWRVPVGALLLWLAVTGMYPGTVVALGYVGGVWVAVWQVVAKPRLLHYLVPLGAAGLVAVLLSAPRLLPYFSLGAADMAIPDDASAFPPSMVGTVLFGYSSGLLPNDITMRSFFVPAVVLVLATLAPIRSELTKLGAALVLPSAVLGLPLLPWFTAAQGLPGIGVSRFTMSDFKVFLVFGVVLLASAGISALGDHVPRGRREAAVQVSLLGFTVLILIVAAMRGPYTVPEVVPQLVILALTIAVVGAAVTAGRAELAAQVVGALVVLTAISGAVWALDNSAPWKAPRLATEEAVFGGKSVDKLIDDAAPVAEHVRRPARIPLPATYTAAELRGQSWNSAYYANDLSVGGYANLRSFDTQTKTETALLDPQSGPTLADFLSAEGVVVTSPEGEVTTRQIRDCLHNADCGPTSVEPVSWLPGMSRYNVTGTAPTTALVAESYYRGWRAEACAKPGECVDVPTSSSPTGLLSMRLPAGDYRLVVTYVTPGLRTGWLFFAMGACGMMLWAAALLLVSGRRKPPTTRREPLT